MEAYFEPRTATPAGGCASGHPDYTEVGTAVVSLLVFQSLPDGSGYEVLAEATVLRGKLQLHGRRDDLVDTQRRVYSPRRKRFVRFEKDPEEWLRSFAESFRTAHVGAAIVRDTEFKDLEAPRAFVEELTGARV
jgi:hypothetical protein